jgi:hypothetical protein
MEGRLQTLCDVKVGSGSGGHSLKRHAGRRPPFAGTGGPLAPACRNVAKCDPINSRHRTRNCSGTDSGLLDSRHTRHFPWRCNLQRFREAGLGGRIRGAGGCRRRERQESLRDRAAGRGPGKRGVFRMRQVISREGRLRPPLRSSAFGFSFLWRDP